MPYLSKYTFDKCICSSTPCSLFHPWNSNCREGIAVFMCNQLFGTLKFWLPIYVVKLMLNYKRIDKEYLWSQLLAYFRSVSYGVTYGGLVITSCCTIAKLYFNYFILMEAGTIGGLSLLIETTENKNLNALLYFNLFIEAIINTLTSTKTIKRTRTTETFAFMVVVSILMYLFRTRVKKQKFPMLWFYPERSIYLSQEISNDLISEDVCHHKRSCVEYSLEGGYNYFLIGFLVEIIRKFLPRMFLYLKNPSYILRLIINGDNLMMGSFLGGFAALYRFICCYFKNKEKKELPRHSLTAAFVAGATYYIKPNLQVFIIALTSMLQLLWERFSTHLNLPTKIPYAEIIFCLTSGLLLHFRFVAPEQCPKYVKNMSDIATNNMTTKMYAHVMTSIKETEKYLSSLTNV